jgi:hypothetical protein
MKVRTIVARHMGCAITPKTKWRLYAGNSQLQMSDELVQFGWTLLRMPVSINAISAGKGNLRRR